MQVARITIAQICQAQGPKLAVPAGIDGVKLLWALAGNESSFGLEANPRHEAAYCRGGKYFDPKATGAYGCWAHCSYGPWQVMFANLIPGIPPETFNNNPSMVCGAAVGLINRRILKIERAVTLDEIATAYNEGDWRNRKEPAEYVAELIKNYAIPVGEMA